MRISNNLRFILKYNATGLARKLPCALLQRGSYRGEGVFWHGSQVEKIANH